MQLSRAIIYTTCLDEYIENSNGMIIKHEIKMSNVQSTNTS